VSGQPPSNNSPSNVRACGSSPGYRVDARLQNAILALMQWVENGTAPDTIVGSGSGFSRPLCPYPTVSIIHCVFFERISHVAHQFAKYVGGDNTLASSFVCQ
jgi:feruloyl esterase